MEQKQKEQKTAQILYITIIMVLIIMALAVGLVTATNKKSAPKVTSDEITSSFTEKDHVSPSVTTEVSTTVTTVPPTTTAQSTTPKPVVNIEEPDDYLPDFAMPTNGNISKLFSIDALVYSNTMEDYRTHSGIDICASAGDAVMAAANGTVTEVYEHPMMGHTVVIAHSGDSKTVYQNLSDEIPVRVGDTVKCGDIIGAIGESALIEIAEEPHLHFELFVNGKVVDPTEFMSTETMTIIYEE